VVHAIRLGPGGAGRGGFATVMSLDESLLLIITGNVLRDYLSEHKELVFYINDITKRRFYIFIILAS